MRTFALDTLLAGCGVRPGLFGNRSQWVNKEIKKVIQAGLGDSDQRRIIDVSSVHLIDNSILRVQNCVVDSKSFDEEKRKKLLRLKELADMCKDIICELVPRDL